MNKPKPGLVTVKLDRDVYSKVEHFVKKGNRGEGGIRKFVNDTIDMSVGMHLIRKHIHEPFLKFVAVATLWS